jgi:hypothetical protein
MSDNNIYRDENGSKVFVSSGIATDGKTWMTVRRKPGIGKGTHRIKSPALPIRDSFARAQEDLDAYAKQKGWSRYDQA